MQVIYVADTENFKLEFEKPLITGYAISDERYVRVRHNYDLLRKEIPLSSNAAVITNISGMIPSIPPEDDIQNPSSPYYPLAYITKIRQLLSEPDEGPAHQHYIYRMIVAVLSNGLQYFNSNERAGLVTLTAIPYDRRALSALEQLQSSLPKDSSERCLADDTYKTLASLLRDKMGFLDSMEQRIYADLAAHGLPNDFPIKNIYPYLEILDVFLVHLTECAEVQTHLRDIGLKVPAELTAPGFGKTELINLSGHSFSAKPSLEQILRVLDEPKTIITDIPLWKHYRELDAQQPKYRAHR